MGARLIAEIVGALVLAAALGVGATKLFLWVVTGLTTEEKSQDKEE